MGNHCLCDNMRKSPMFNLSVASRELFHSSFLYWLSQAYPSVFKEVIKKLGVNTSGWNNDWKAQREVNHFDLSVVRVSNPNEYLLILENKVKSIPNKQQLDNYKAKISTCQNYLLLSLSVQFPQKQEIQKSGWKIANYQQLAIALYSVVDDVKNPYHRDLILDYCSYIICLHGFQRKWNYVSTSSYNNQFVTIEEDANGLTDVGKKVLYSRLAVELGDKIPNARSGNNKDIVEDSQKTPWGVYINWGMTRGTGLIDVKIRILGNLMLVIQLQGNNLKHCIEVLGKDAQDKQNLASLSNNRKQKINGVSYGNVIDKLIEINFFNIETDQVANYCLDESKYEKPNAQNLFNAYNDTFFYQYVKIADTTTVEEVVQSIIEQCKHFTTEFKKLASMP